MNKYKPKNFFLELLMWALSFVTLYPLAMVVITSFKDYSEASFLSIQLPEVWKAGNYAQVFTEGKILRSLINSCIITLPSVVLVVLLSSMLGFYLTRRRTRANRIIYKILTFGIIAPFAALPTIQLLKYLGIYGSYISLVFVYAALYLPFSTMLFSRFIATIPKELDEAAVIDGCTGFTLFRRIIFPLLKPTTITVAMLNFIWVWNDFQYPMYLVNTSTKWTLPMSVYSFYGQYNRSWHLVCADMVLVSLPVIIIYLLAQKHIIAGMTAGAVKG